MSSRAAIPSGEGEESTAPSATATRRTDRRHTGLCRSGTSGAVCYAVSGPAGPRHPNRPESRPEPSRPQFRGEVSMKTIVHIVGTGTIGEPLLGLFTDFRDKMGIDEVTFHKRTPLPSDRPRLNHL